MSSSMSGFFDTGTDDPEGQSSTKTGMQKGAAIGSMFGPYGALIGAGIGMLVGGAQGNGARMRARRKATQQAYAFNRDAQSYLGKGRGQVEDVYQSKLANTRARMAGSGADLEGTQWQSAQGELLRERDEATGTLNREENEFLSGPSSKWLREDYASMTSIGSRRSVSGKEGEDSARHYYIGWRAKGASNERVFTMDQLKAIGGHRGDKLKRRDDISEQVKSRSWAEMAKRAMPTLKEYARGIGGGPEAKAEYRALVDKKIADAKEWYGVQQTLDKVTIANKEEFENRDWGKGSQK